MKGSTEQYSSMARSGGNADDIADKATGRAMAGLRLGKGGDEVHCMVLNRCAMVVETPAASEMEKLTGGWEGWAYRARTV